MQTLSGYPLDLVTRILNAIIDLDICGDHPTLGDAVKDVLGDALGEETMQAVMWDVDWDARQ